MPQDDAASAWKSFSPERRDALLKKMTPEQKKKLRTTLEGGVTSSTPVTPALSISATPPAASIAGIKSRAYNLAQTGLEALPTVGGIAGGIIGGSGGSVEPGGGTVAGAVAGATVGGSAGKVLEQAGKKALFKEEPPETLGAEAKTVGWEGLKQGLYEIGGRILGGAASRVGSRVFKGAGPKAGEEIAGVKIPETMGQMSGKAGGLFQQVEHYTKGTFAGQPLKDIQQAQEDAARRIVNKLAGHSEGLSMSENWARAREATRIMADPMYESLREIPAPEGQKVANSILEDDTLRLSSKIKKLLGKSAGGGLFTDLGYKTQKEAEEKLGKTTIEQLMKKDPRLSSGATTVGDLIEARSEIGKLARGTTDPAERARLWETVDQINQAVDKGLSPEQLSVKHEADKLWRRSYIMDGISDDLSKMEASQDPLKQKRVAVDAFVKMVNDLAETPIGREGGGIVKRQSNLERLFDDPKDRQAMKQLASFLKSKYSRLAGSVGIAENFAKLSVIFDAVGAVGILAAGNPATAASTAAPIAMLYATAKILADPGGAQRVLQAVRGVPGIAGAATLRTAGFAAEQANKPQNRKQALELLGR